MVIHRAPERVVLDEAMHQEQLRLAAEIDLEDRECSASDFPVGGIGR